MLENDDVKSIIVLEVSQMGTYGNYEYVLQADMFQADENISAEEKSSDRPVYILYTSGSTGMPKGVAVTLKGFLTFLEAVYERIGFTKGEKIACFTTLSFDIFFWKRYWDWCSEWMWCLRMKMNRTARRA